MNIGICSNAGKQPPKRAYACRFPEFHLIHAKSLFIVAMLFFQPVNLRL